MKTLEFGQGLRPDHDGAILSERASVGFFGKGLEASSSRRIGV
jgi:hypothetical protein